MAIYRGQIRKMKGVYQERVNYFMRLTDNELIDLNNFIGHNLIIRYLGDIFCVQCGRKTKKAFNKVIAFLVCVKSMNAEIASFFLNDA